MTELLKTFVASLDEEINTKYRELADFKARRNYLAKVGTSEKEAYIRGLEMAKMKAELLLINYKIQ